MIWSRIWSCTVALVIGVISSTRRSKLRVIQSAEEMNSLALSWGSSRPLAKQMMRLCSRKRPTIDLTRIFSDSPGTPGRRQQMPRTTSSMRTPRWLARYRASMMAGSTSEFSLTQMAAGLPWAAADISLPIRSIRVVFMFSGDTTSASSSSGWA